MDSLRAWFFRGADGGYKDSLRAYFEKFGFPQHNTEVSRESNSLVILALNTAGTT